MTYIMCVTPRVTSGTFRTENIGIMADIAGLSVSCDLGWDEADVNTLLLDIAITVPAITNSYNR